MTSVTQLEWSEPSPPNSQCGYHHTYADTPFGSFLITWKGWKEEDAPTLDLSPCGEFYCGATIDDVKQEAQKQFERAVMRCLSS
jgi:hypothetical protein